MQKLATVIVAEGALDMAATKIICAAISAMTDRGQVDLVLDWSRVEALHPLAIGFLLNSQHALLEKNGELKFCQMRPAVRKIFFDFGVAEFFESYATLESAIESFDQAWGREEGIIEV